eukprot:365393-Chlamydomonas_euryale.AAC.6
MAGLCTLSLECTAPVPAFGVYVIDHIGDLCFANDTGPASTPGSFSAAGGQAHVSAQLDSLCLQGCLLTGGLPVAQLDRFAEVRCRCGCLVWMPGVDAWCGCLVCQGKPSGLK